MAAGKVRRRTSGPTCSSSTPPCRPRRFRNASTRFTPSSRTINSAPRATPSCSRPGTTRWTSRSATTRRSSALGASPDSVHITGNVHSDATLPNNNATCTFWKAAEGFSVTPTGGTMQWAVSQAVPFRRMHVRGNIVLHQSGWASGGWMSDALIDGNVGAGRNSNGSRGTPSGAVGRARTGTWSSSASSIRRRANGPTPPYTKIAQTPIVREKPFLQVDAVRRVQRPRSRAAHQQRRASPGAADRRRENRSRSSEFYIATAGRRHRRDHQRPACQGQEPAVHARHLRADRYHSRARAPNTVVLGLGLRHARRRTTAPRP